MVYNVLSAHLVLLCCIRMPIVKLYIYIMETKTPQLCNFLDLFYQKAEYMSLIHAWF